MEIAASEGAVRAAAAAWSRARVYDDKLGDPDKARLAAWAESIQRWALQAPDLIEAVCRYYEGSTDGRTIGIGDLLHHGREVRRQRAESEKAAEVHAEVAYAAAGALTAGYSDLPINATGRPVWAAYEVRDAITRPCPNCGAEPDYSCVSATGQSQRIPCVARITGRSHAIRHAHDTA